MTATEDILLETPRTKQDDEEDFYWVKDRTGRVRKHARATSFTGLLDSDWALQKYKDRMLAHGIGRRSDLAQLARNHDPKTEKQFYDRTIIPQARAAADADAKANVGTALHMDTQLLDRGVHPVTLDPEWRHHHHAYRNTIQALPFTVDPDHIERTVILDEYTVAGTIDRVLIATTDLQVTFPNKRQVVIAAGDKIIGDLKTGKWGMEYNDLKWAMQCAIYSAHAATWRPGHSDDPNITDRALAELGERGPAIGVRADIALVIHLIAGDPTAPCDVHWLDLETGYDAFLCAVEIKGHRAAARKAHRQFTEYLPSTFDTACETWARERLAALPPPAADALRRQWPLRDPDTGQLAKYEHPTPEQTRALLAALDLVETAYQLPLTAPPVRPGDPQTQEPHATQGEPQ